MNTSKIKAILMGLGLTALSLVVIFAAVRRAPANVRALFQA